MSLHAAVNKREERRRLEQVRQSQRVIIFGIVGIVSLGLVAQLLLSRS